MNLLDIPNYYLLAALFGMTGQGLRGVLGILKTIRARGKVSLSWIYFSTTLSMGLLSGIMGGLIYDLGQLTPSTITDEQLWNDRNFILMAISAGYFGADAIEGILGKASPADIPR